MKNKTTKVKKDRAKKKSSGTSSNNWFKKIVLIFLILFLMVSILILIAGLIFYHKYGSQLIQYQKEAIKTVESSTSDTFRQMETSLVYDTRGELLSVVKGEKDVYYQEYSHIPDDVKDAMISIEDKKFLIHEGVDGLAIIRAALALIRNEGDVTQGASTITQQLARNIFLSNEVTWERKLKEMFIAVELEKKYDKKQIMEFYLNNIYFANGYYGIEAASEGYFSKSSDELSLSEIAFLCAIPNNPTIYDPITNLENTLERRNRILTQMYEDGRINEQEYKSARTEEIEIVLKKATKNNYIDTFVFYNATRALMAEEGFEFRYEFENEADRKQYEDEYYELYNQFQKSLFYEGYRIYTSIDLEKQQQLQKSVDDTLAAYQEVNKEGTYTLQSGAVSIDNQTGKVVAIVGGRFQETVGYTLNRGYQSFRQPGSAIKPLIVYTPSFERDYYPDSMVVDEPIEDGPQNSTGSYMGKIKLSRAIELSKNTIAWKLFEELTPKVGLSYLLKMNFVNIDANDYTMAASLGGFTVGVSPLEMTAAYTALENDGLYREPTCIIKILDADGNIVVGEEISGKRIYDVNAARMMTDSLTGVMKNGTGKGLGLKNMPSAGKTGTTNNNKDGWFVGYTPYYTTGVWVGYDIPKTLGNLYGATLPGAIWNSYMSAIHKGLEKLEFPEYEDNRPQAEIIKEEDGADKDTTEEITEETTEETAEKPEETQAEEPVFEETETIPETETTTDDNWTDPSTEDPSMEQPVTEETTWSESESWEENPVTEESEAVEQEEETEEIEDGMW
ncbi:MAG: hypothetical protein K0R92_1743 [Lachnospiraceae bacterium]|jgi:1A family penicillin-binding protein|nr:hypothetical protein [Lachnospiraceae bacterium]